MATSVGADVLDILEDLPLGIVASMSLKILDQSALLVTNNSDCDIETSYALENQCVLRNCRYSQCCSASMSAAMSINAWIRSAGD